MIDPSKVYDELTEAGNDHADKKAAADLLESTLKILKAKLAVSYRESLGCAMSEAEARALASEEYSDHLGASVNARKAEQKALVRYKAAQSWLDAKRTAEASHRAASKVAP